MSYARCGNDSDVYVIRDPNLQFICFPGTNKLHEAAFVCKTHQEMLEHLLLHRTVGDLVPERTINRIKLEMDLINYTKESEG